MTATTQSIIDKVVQLIINPAIQVIFWLGFLMFVFGAVEYLWNLNKGKKNDKNELIGFGFGVPGSNHMLYGILGMFIMVSVYGIISVISNTLGLNITPGNPSTYTVPNFNVPTFTVPGGQ